MTAVEAAAAMRRVADALETLRAQNLKFPRAMLEGEAAVGAAGFLCYLRDLVTASPKESYTRDELLVLLEICSRDAEMFPTGVGVVMWDLEDQ